MQRLSQLNEYGMVHLYEMLVQSWYVSNTADMPEYAEGPGLIYRPSALDLLALLEWPSDVPPVRYLVCYLLAQNRISFCNRELCELLALNHFPLRHEIIMKGGLKFFLVVAWRVFAKFESCTIICAAPKAAAPKTNPLSHTIRMSEWH